MSWARKLLLMGGIGNIGLVAFVLLVTQGVGATPVWMAVILSYLLAGAVSVVTFAELRKSPGPHRHLVLSNMVLSAWMLAMVIVLLLALNAFAPPLNLGGILIAILILATWSVISILGSAISLMNPAKQLQTPDAARKGQARASRAGVAPPYRAIASILIAAGAVASITVLALSISGYLPNPPTPPYPSVNGRDLAVSISVAAAAGLLTLIRWRRQAVSCALYSCAAALGLANSTYFSSMTVSRLGFQGAFVGLELFAPWGLLLLAGGLFGIASLLKRNPSRISSAQKLSLAGAVLLIALTITVTVLIQSTLRAAVSNIGGGAYQIEVPLQILTYPHLYSLLSVYTAFGIALPAALMALVWISKRRGRSSPWYLAQLPAAVAASLTLYVLPQVLFSNSTVWAAITSPSFQIPPLLGGIGGGSYQSAPLVAAASIGTCIMLLAGSLLAVGGAAYALRDRLRYMACVAIGTAVIIGALSLVSQAVVTANNHAAIQSLDGYIGGWNHNVAYLLANYSAFNASTPNNTAIYTMLLKSSSANQTISGIFSLPKQFQTVPIPAASNASINGEDWGAKNPILSTYLYASLYSLGVLPDLQGGVPTLGFDSRFLRPVPIIYGMYSLLFTGQQILYVAVQLGDMFSCGMFSSPTNSTLAAGETIYGYQASIFGSIQATTLVPSGTYNLYPVSGFPAGWLALMQPLGSLPQMLSSGGMQCKAKDYSGNITKRWAFTTGDYFYGLSLDQDLGTMVQNSYYGLNSTQASLLLPSIGYIGYSANYTVVDLMNLNLTSPGNIALYMDNRSVAFTRYYNFLVSRQSLGIGSHSLAVEMTGARLPVQSMHGFLPSGRPNESTSYLTNLTLNGTLYVSPPLTFSPYIVGRTLSLGTSSSSPSPFTISNLTVTPQQYQAQNYLDGPVNPAGDYSGRITIGPLTKGANYTRANFTANYTLPAYCNIGDEYGFNLTYDSGYGMGRYTYVTKCT